MKVGHLFNQKWREVMKTYIGYYLTDAKEVDNFFKEIYNNFYIVTSNQRVSMS